MKKCLLVCIFCCIAVLQASSQCTDCYNGYSLHHTGNNPRVAPVVGEDTLSVIFNSTLCGLNYVQALQMTETRSKAAVPAFNTNGTGLSTYDTVKGLPAACYTIIKAYLYCEASTPNAASTYNIVDTVTNPLAVKAAFTPVLVRQAGGKCWGDNGTGTWRADITSEITGNGPYRINFSGFTKESYWVDGVSIVVIYQDNTAMYTGTLVLSDGEITIYGGGTVTYTAKGFNACAAASATAFMDIADAQNSGAPLPATFNTTENGTAGGPYPAAFFQSCPVNTNVTLGQTTTTSTMTRTSDCFAYFLSGLYFQTACLTCTPASPLTYTTQNTPAPCGKDSGTAKITVTSDTTGVTYIWSTGSTADSIYGLAPGSYCVVVKSPGACYIDTVCFTITSGSSLSSNITATKDSVCPGTTDTLTLFGSGGATYKWSPGGSTNATLHVTLTTTTTYTLYTYQAACSDSAKITIKLIPKVTDTLTAIHDTVCPHDSTILTATSAGGQSTYKWSTGATSSSITVMDTVTTTYTATAYGICDSVPKMIKVTVIPLPKPVIKGASLHCKGQKDTLTVTGGTTYLWSNGSTTNKYITGNINADSTVTLIAFNSLYCSDTIKIPITYKNPPTITINPPAVACAGAPVELYSNVSGGGPYTYLWTPGGETTDSISVTDSVQTNYVLTVSNGCKTNKTTTVTPDAPVISACCDKVIISGDDTTIVASGDTSILSYVWNPMVNCLNPPLCNSVSVSPTVTTTYTVIGTDRAGCQTERVVTITVETPCFNFTVPNVITPTDAGGLGLNNMLYIKTTGLNSWSILVYDRWGKEMFNSTNPTQYWDGTSKGGGNAPDGVYYYVINATCQGNSYKKDGFIQLIR